MVRAYNGHAWRATTRARNRLSGAVR